MFRLIKNLFSRNNGTPVETPDEADAPSAAPVEPTTEVLADPPAPPVIETTATASSAAPTAAPVEVPAAPAAQPRFDCMKIPISAILPGVAEELRHKLSPHSARELLVPVDRVTSQLAGGAICVPLGVLRPLSPEVLSDIPLKDDCAVNLPLAEVLKNLGPEHYKKRTNQKAITVPEDIDGLFGLKGQKVFISSTPPLKPEAPKPARPLATPAAPAPLGAGGRGAGLPAASPNARIPGPAPIRPAQPIPPGQALPSRPGSGQPMAPSAPIPMLGGPGMPGRPGGFHTSPPFKPQGLAPVQPAPTPNPLPAAPRMGSGLAPTQPLPAQAPVPSAPIPAPASLPRPTAPSAPAAKPAPSVAGEPLVVSLSQVSHAWPAEVRHDIAGMNLGTARLALPLEEVEQALKSGKVQFSWKQVCLWFDPPVAVTPSPAAGEMMVDLPLKIVATLFMARYRPAAVQRKSEVAEDIPDLFGKNAGKTPASAPTGAHPVRPLSPIAQVHPLPRPAPLPNVAAGSALPGAARPATPAPAAPAAPAGEAALDLNALLGPPGQRLPVKEIIANTARLPGAAGALLAMSDGLLVSSAVPSNLKDEVVAAFLPQIFGRMTQYARELSLGGVRAVTLTVEGGSWQILKESNVYFAVLCRPDKTIPLSQLAVIAAELNKQQQ
jgi:predicted regulator of Ras-like GTPase activity (Roadblock/LC7/MglB family)